MQFLSKSLSLSAALAVGFVALHAGSAQANECRVEARGDQSALVLSHPDLLFNDTLGLDRGGHNFAAGVARCDGREVTIAKERSNANGTVTLVVEGHFDDCFVQRSRNWVDTNFDCRGSWNHDNRPLLSQAMQTAARTSTCESNCPATDYMNFDQWNSFYNQVTHLNGPDPTQFPEFRRERDLRMVLGAWCRYAVDAAPRIDCNQRVGH